MDLTENQVHTFPILKNQVIVQCLSEAGIELTEAALTEPHRYRDRVKAVFTSLVRSIQNKE